MVLFEPRVIRFHWSAGRLRKSTRRAGTSRKRTQQTRRNFLPPQEPSNQPNTTHLAELPTEGNLFQGARPRHAVDVLVERPAECQSIQPQRPLDPFGVDPLVEGLAESQVFEVRRPLHLARENMTSGRWAGGRAGEAMRFEWRPFVRSSRRLVTGVFTDWRKHTAGVQHTPQHWCVHACGGYCWTNSRGLQANGGKKQSTTSSTSSRNKLSGRAARSGGDIKYIRPSRTAAHGKSQSPE